MTAAECKVLERQQYRMDAQQHRGTMPTASIA
jgi:hypothetical protein